MVTLLACGGFVRDVLSNETKDNVHPDNKEITGDIDFAIEASSYEAMKEMLEQHFSTFHLCVEQPQYGRLKAGVPLAELGWVRDHYPKQPSHSKLPDSVYCDFVVTRKDGNYLDGRHPTSIQIGTVMDDIYRRDFTMNSIMVVDSTGEIIDPSGGLQDIKNRVIRCHSDTFGHVSKKMSEDMLRLLRALRFSVTLGYNIHESIFDYISKDVAYISYMLSKDIFKSRIASELAKMLKKDTVRSIGLLNKLPVEILEVIFTHNELHLIPSYKAH